MWRVLGGVGSAVLLKFGIVHGLRHRHRPARVVASNRISCPMPSSRSGLAGVRSLRRCKRGAGENGMDGAQGAKHVGGMNAFTWWQDAISRRGKRAAQRFLPIASFRLQSRILSWLALGCLAGAGAWAAPLPGRTPHLDDTVHLLPPIPGDQDALEAKLAEFEARSGIKILVELRERSPAADEDKVPGAYMHALSGREGTLKRGVLVVYFAADSDWRIWIGDELVARFAGKPGTVSQLTTSGAIHEVKEALVNAANERADAGFAALKKNLPGDEMPSPDLKLRLQTEALIDALIAKFSRK